MKSRVKSINIDESTGKAHVEYTMAKEKEVDKDIDIEEAIEDRKKLYKRINLNGILKGNEHIKTPIERAIVKRMINPVVLKAIESNKEMINNYIESLIYHDEQLPFDYVHNLENSNLSRRKARFMNRIALQEKGINGAEVIGEKKRFFGIRNLFKNLKNRMKNFKKMEEPKALEEGQKSKKRRALREDSDIIINLEKREKQLEGLYEGLSPEQQKILSESSLSNVSEIQIKFKIPYNDAYAMVEKYGRKEDVPQTSEKKVEKEAEIS